jgi:hypothetical protein
LWLFSFSPAEDLLSNVDAYARAKVAKCPSVAVAWWLMASYLYYHYDYSLLSDEYYDELCEYLKVNYSSLIHPHKHLIDSEALEAGTGFYLSEEQYPSMCKGAAIRLMDQGIPIETHTLTELF